MSVAKPPKALMMGDWKMKISEARLEAAARAVAKVLGWTVDGMPLVDSNSPRAREWVKVAYAAITARPKREKATTP